MEDPHSMQQCEEDIIPSERTKRKLKTPTQVEALEKFYNEHKYPSELMKLQFAEKIGLSEKQVSGWFCHRRSKDKKYLQGEFNENGKISVSNGAIYDHASGLRQESCSSTKQGDRCFDSKEVESQSLYSQNCSAAVLTSEHSRHTRGGHCAIEDDRPSGSSSASQERMTERDEDPYDLRSSWYPVWKDTKGAKGRRSMMDSSYSHLQREMANPAVSCIKRKLGRHYVDDGPPLGVVFDPLPPGAFDSQIVDSNNDQYYDGDSIQRTSFGISGVIKETKKYDKIKRGKLSSGSNLGGFCSEGTMQWYHHGKKLTTSQITPKASFTKHNNHSSSQTFVVENSDDYEGILWDYNKRKDKYLKYRVDGEPVKDIDHHFNTSGLNSNTNKSLPSPRLQPNCTGTEFQRDEKGFGAKFFTIAPQSSGILSRKSTMPPRRQQGRIHKVRRTLEHHSSVGKEMLMTSETKMGRKTNPLEFEPQDFLVRSKKMQWSEAVLRYHGDAAMSFSGDEETRGGITSSVD